MCYRLVVGLLEADQQVVDQWVAASAAARTQPVAVSPEVTAIVGVPPSAAV